MSNRHSTLSSLFEDIADAIRDKKGEASSVKYTADNFDTAIASIPTGVSGLPELPPYTEWTGTSFVTDKDYKITADDYEVPSGYTLTISAGNIVYMDGFTRSLSAVETTYELGSNVTVNGRIYSIYVNIEDNGIVYGSDSKVLAIYGKYTCYEPSTIYRLEVGEGVVSIEADMRIYTLVASTLSVNDECTLTVDQLDIYSTYMGCCIDGIINVGNLTALGCLFGEGEINLVSQYQGASTVATFCHSMVTLITLNAVNCPEILIWGGLINASGTIDFTGSTVQAVGGVINIEGTITGYDDYTDYMEIPTESLSITTNGTYDVTNYASAVVNASKPEQTKSMSLGGSAPTTVTPDSGYALSSVSPSIDTSIIKADNIKNGVSILGVSGNYKEIDRVSSVPSTKSSDIIYNTTNGSYYLWEN